MPAIKKIIDDEKSQIDEEKYKIDEEKLTLLRKYASSIIEIGTYALGPSVSQDKLDNAINKFANGLDKNRVIGFFDTSLFGNGKLGYIFTDTKIYYQSTLEKPRKIWYDDIKSVHVINSGKKDSENRLAIYLHDGTYIEWMDCSLNKSPLCSFFLQMINLIENSKKQQEYASIKYNTNDFSGAVAGGYSAGAYKHVNKLFEEEKFHSNQGHGFAAERANNLYDQLTGHDARIVGDDNIKNGADRIVDGTMIQSKYCNSGSACVNDCFDENGIFRYMQDGKPMQIEVPLDKFDAAVEALERKIREGKVPGVTDPAEAKNIIRKGHFTYEQARNIAKAGTIESLSYDAVNGMIIATSAFGITAVITFATNVWNGEDFYKSLKLATYSGLKVGGTAFATTIIASQLSKAGLNSALVGSSESIVGIMGSKASATLINAFRNGTNIYGAAAMKSAAKLLRGNAITAGVTFVVLSTFDVANIFRGRISGRQLFKNLTNTASTVASGTGGWIAGAACGSTIAPGIGTVIGGLVGSIVSGVVVGKASSVVLDNFLEDDAEEMVRIIQKEFENLAQDYLLNYKEAEKTADRLQEKIDGKLLKDMFASENRHQFARDILIPIIERETNSRRHIQTPSDNQMVLCLKEVLEDISGYYDNEEQYSMT